jgi:hypothetical protein
MARTKGSKSSAKKKKGSKPKKSANRIAGEPSQRLIIVAESVWMKLTSSSKMARKELLGISSIVF